MTVGRVSFQATARDARGAFVAMAPDVRFWAKVDRRGPDECWPWLGTLTKAGYGVMQAGGRGSRQLRAHRIAFELVVGPIPEGLTLDHLCRNRACVNPEHLEPVTLAENTRRGIGWQEHKTHCPQGHPYSPENTQRGSAVRPSRKCATCHRDGMRRLAERRRAA